MRARISRVSMVVPPSTPPRWGREQVVVPIADQHPRLTLETGSRLDANASLGDVLEPDSGELDAAAASRGRNGALSRTRLSQLEVRDGLELSLWVPAAGAS